MERRNEGARPIERIPHKGERIEVMKSGTPMRATVHYADHIQILVKFDTGLSRSLRPGRDAYRIVEQLTEDGRAAPA